MMGMTLSMGDTVMHKTVNSPLVNSTNVTVGEKDGKQINEESNCSHAESHNENINETSWSDWDSKG